MDGSVLVRYGTISEVARFQNVLDAPLQRGQRVVVRTHRGIEIGTLLQETPPTSPATQNDEGDFQILRASTGEDEEVARQNVTECQQQFVDWRRRIEDWKIQLELIDLERTLDNSKLILYVLNDRGPESTRLALQAAAAGLGIIEVQPVGPEGLIPLARSGGCGSGGCGSDGDSCCS
jgi:cell fate regulator YaaT (PSP1 superfamily)